MGLLKTLRRSNEDVFPPEVGSEAVGNRNLNTLRRPRLDRLAGLQAPLARPPIPVGRSVREQVAVRTRDPDKTEASLGSRDLVVEQVPVSSLKPYANNPRTHTKKQIRQIAESIKTFGWMNPVLVDANDRIIAGHGRDNKLAELAGWDEQTLAKELQFLTELNLDFDLEVTGFEMGEIDVLIEGQSAGTQPNPLDDIPEIDEAKAPVSLIGDVWLLGPHRLACGNALSTESYALLMGHRRAQIVFTDPPYNVSINGLSANGAAKHPEFVMASGEMSPEEFTEFLARALGHHASYSQQGAIHFVCMDWRHLGELLRAREIVYSWLKNLCVWKKTNAGMGSFYRRWRSSAAWSAGCGWATGVD